MKTVHMIQKNPMSACIPIAISNSLPRCLISEQHEQRKPEERNMTKAASTMKGSTKFEPLDDVKNIMITGGAGFIAGWLVRHLVATYPSYKVVSFDKLDYSASLNNTRFLEDRPNFVFHRGDITSSADLMSCLRTHGIDTIFHFAAQSHVDLSFTDPYQFTKTNIHGTHVLLECSLAVGIRRFIHISTDEVYGEAEADSHGFTENSTLTPTNPYAASKAAAEMLVNSYWRSFKLPIIIVRPNNVYGPGQFPEKIVPKFTLLLNRGKNIFLHGDGQHTRHYLYAGDAADAFDTILHRGSIGQVYNIGSHDEISNLEVCRRLVTLLELPEPWGQYITTTPDRPFNDRRYHIDGSKLQSLGWKQRTEFDEGLVKTFCWYKRFGEHWWGDVGQVIGTPFAVARCSEDDISTMKSPI